jgi:hypothetical protein
MLILYKLVFQDLIVNFQITCCLSVQGAGGGMVEEVVMLGGEVDGVYAVL